MRPRYVGDTNVVFAASAADPVNPKDIDATPDVPELREQVWDWLDRFQRGDSRMVLDASGRISRVSKGVTTLAGVPPDRMIGRTPADALAGGAGAGLYRSLSDALSPPLSQGAG